MPPKACTAQALEPPIERMRSGCSGRLQRPALSQPASHRHRTRPASEPKRNIELRKTASNPRARPPRARQRRYRTGHLAQHALLHRTQQCPTRAFLGWTPSHHPRCGGSRCRKVILPRPRNLRSNGCEADALVDYSVQHLHKRVSVIVAWPWHANTRHRVLKPLALAHNRAGLAGEPRLDVIRAWPRLIAQNSLVLRTQHRPVQRLPVCQRPPTSARWRRLAITTPLWVVVAWPWHATTPLLFRNRWAALSHGQFRTPSSRFDAFTVPMLPPVYNGQPMGWNS